jgi:hypothetical protein
MSRFARSPYVPGSCVCVYGQVDPAQVAKRARSPVEKDGWTVSVPVEVRELLGVVREPVDLAGQDGPVGTEVLDVVEGLRQEGLPRRGVVVLDMPVLNQQPLASGPNMLRPSSTLSEGTSARPRRVGARSGSSRATRLLQVPGWMCPGQLTS